MARLTRSPIDAFVGGRVKMRRGLMGMSQTELANQLGITFQQVQKYEKGANRIGASRLYQISEVLGVPVQFFFEGVSNVVGGSGMGMGNVPDADRAELKGFEDFMKSPAGIELCKSFTRIEDATVQKRLLLLVKSLSETSLSR